MGIIFILCIAVAVTSLITMAKAIEHQNIEAIFMFFVSLVCSTTPLLMFRYWAVHYMVRGESVYVNLITEFGIAGLVCFMVGLFFLFYPKGKSVR